MISRHVDFDRSYSVIDQLRRRMDRLFVEGVQATGRGGLDYRRSFAVPQGIDGERIAANLQNGVLRLSLPKPAAAKPRQIEIKSA